MAAPVAVLGARGLANAITDSRGKSWAGLARLVEARENQLAVLTSLMRTVTSTSTEYNWFEKGIPTFEVLSDGSASASATDLTFKADGGGGVNFNFRDGIEVKNDRTEEIVLVIVDPTSNTGAVKVSRNYGDIGAFDIEDGDRWTIIGLSDQDNKTSPKAISSDPVRKTNYIQLMREPIELGLMAAIEEFRTGPEYNRLRKDAFLEFIRRWERQFMHGQPRSGAGSSADVERNQTGGILRPISSNVRKFGGVVSETGFKKELIKAFRFGARRKVGVCGNTSADVIDSMARFSGGTIYLEPGESIYGLEINEYRHALGRIMLLATPSLTISTNYDNIIVLIDTMQLSRVLFPGLDFKLRKNVQENGVLGIKDEYIMACGLKLGLEQHHAKWTGMTSFQA